MQNTTQQPQQFYTKPSTAPLNTQPLATGTQTPQKKKKSLRTLFAVVGLVLFALVAVMGVFIAQKQVAQDGADVTPVAPNAPESQPEASTAQPNSCVTYFFVAQPEVVCDSKIALTDYTSNQGVPIPPESKFNTGDEFVFKIMVSQPTQGYVEDVTVVDILPESLQFVSAPENSNFTLINQGQKITATIPKMESSSEVAVEFKVRIVSNMTADYTNVATIESNQTTKESPACKYPFKTLKGSVECVEKTMTTLQGAAVTGGSALERGEQYIYYISVKAINKPYGEVKIHDQIPAPLEYVKPAPGSEKYITQDPVKGLVLANLSELEADATVSLGIIVEVPQDPALGVFTNKALVYALPPDSLIKEPLTNQGSCEISHTILPIGTAECVSKEAYSDFNGTVIASGSEIDPTDSFIYKITVRAEETTAGPVTISDILPAELLFIEDNKNSDSVSYNQNTREVTANLGVLQSGQQVAIEFKVQLIADPSAKTFTNTATITTNETTNHSCEIPLKVTQPEYSCNSTCEVQADCSSLGEDYICHPTGTNSSACRLADNPNDVDCKPAKIIPPTTPPPTGPATPGPTPAPGCNEICTANADCTNSAHICVTTNDGSNRCRLAEYTASTTCTEPVVATTTQQPVLPETLPQSGPADWLNWLKAGLITLGVGTALFLLL